MKGCKGGERQKEGGPLASYIRWGDSPVIAQLSLILLKTPIDRLPGFKCQHPLGQVITSVICKDLPSQLFPNSAGAALVDTLVGWGTQSHRRDHLHLSKVGLSFT